MFVKDVVLHALAVKGEASNVKYHSSGHIYFTLKDAKGTMACVMFAGNRSGLLFQLIDGQQIIVMGNVDIYERDGKYQLYAREILLEGGGLLYKRFEELKQKLYEMGIFDSVYKQTIPAYAQKIGVVTASTGAAIRDIIQVAKRRNPFVEIILYPAIVQGDQASESIVKGIKVLEQYGVDVMIVGRGGGSIEDLWAFNEERVAQAIFDSGVPIISAVGHETDTTIADFVADLRAPTPSAAAELAVFDWYAFQQKMEDIHKILGGLMKSHIQTARGQTQSYQKQLTYNSPLSKLNQQKQYLDYVVDKLAGEMDKRLRSKRHELALLAQRLKGRSPLDKISQGYGFVSDIHGKSVLKVSDVLVNDQIKVHLGDGVLTTTVQEIMSFERKYDE